MTKKNRKSKKNEEQLENQPVEEKAEANESASAGDEATVSQEESTDISVDDLLDDVRRSLIEENSEAEESTGWLGKLTKGRRKEQKLEEPVEVQPIAEPQVETIADQGLDEQADEYVDQIDQLIDMLEPEVAETISEPEIEAAPIALAEPVEPEEPVDLGELKKRAFARSDETRHPEEDFSQVRAVALEGGEDVFIEVEAKTEDVQRDRAKALENSLRPYRAYIYFLIAFLAVIMAILAGTVMYRTYQNTRPPTPTPVERNLPFPTQITLPGGLSFPLGKGQIVEGRWDPQGPEWLRGTEICRWVAIPWSRPLEAAVRTLTRDDSIELLMSNNDRLTYDVFGIDELTLDQMQALDQNSPCLLVVLAEQDADARWVVTAKP